MSWKRSPGPMLLVAFLALPAAQADPQGAPRLRIDMQVEKEISRKDPSGEAEVRRVPVEVAGAGDVLVYTLQIVNEGEVAAMRARVVDPIPEGTILIPDSAEGKGTHIAYSIDGGTHFASFPLTRQVMRSDGEVEEVPVPVEEYTHVRWTLTEPLAPGQARSAHFKVRVE